MPTRRFFMGSVAGIPAAAMIGTSSGSAAAVQSSQIADLFASLPGDISYLVLAPATDAAPQVRLSRDARRQLFVGSAFKAFVLAEILRQADSPDVVANLTGPQLALDESVWSADSATFNPPFLSGKVSLRTALEAMILHSDNTATDIALKYIGPDKVRGFIGQAGLSATLIPDSTRVFLGYLLGAPDYKTFTWQELQAASNAPFVNSPLNGVETMASSAHDLVSYYRRALSGAFFQHPETLTALRSILSIGDVIWITPFPLGASAFAKGGSLDVPGFHALCVPGGIFFNNRWVYFAFTINWYAEAETDPPTGLAFVKAVQQALDLVFTTLSA